MLAVATHDPAAVAETYVRQHMRMIAPGRTVGIALSGTQEARAQGADVGIPFFCASAPRRGAFSRLRSAERLVRRGYPAALSPGDERALLRFLDHHGVTTLLAEFGTTGSALRYVCRKAGIPLFVNFHGHDATVLPRRWHMPRAYRLLARDARGIICGSRHFRGILERLGFPRDKIAVIPCGIEAERFEVGVHDPHLVVAIGRLTEKKRPDLMLRAFALAAAAHPELRLEVVGDGPYRARCEELVRQLGLAERVVLHGACTHDFVRRLLGRAGLFVQHSMTARNGDQESQGISLLEAMAASLPVVATNHNGFHESVLHGRTGLLSPEGNIEAMAANLMRLAAAPGLGRRFGAAGRQRVEIVFSAARTTTLMRDFLGIVPDGAGARVASAAAAACRRGAAR